MKNLCRGLAARLAVAAMTLLATVFTVGLAASPARADDKLATRPDFRLPFGCGETWQLTYKDHHMFPRKQVDFYLPGEGLSGGYAVYVSAPGWVTEPPAGGEVEIHHGNGWFTTYQHMTDISVSEGMYVGRGFVIGKVGNVGVTMAGGTLPGPAHLHYEQSYQPGVTNANFNQDNPNKEYPHLEGETFDLGVTGTQVRTSTNNCSGGAPGGAVQFDIPAGGVHSMSVPVLDIFTRRASDNKLYERWYMNGAWAAEASPHTIVGQPAVAVFRGETHIIARTSNGSIFDYVYNNFTGWRTTYLAGVVTSDPDVAIYGWHKNLHVAARGTDGKIYRWWTQADGSWSSPSKLDDMQITGAPALFALYDRLYVVAHASSNDSVWSWTYQDGFVPQFLRNQLPGATSDNPEIAVDPVSRRINVVIRGTNNYIYRWQGSSSSSGTAWDSPELVDGSHQVTGAPAALIYHGALHIVARGLYDGTIHHWWKDSIWNFQTPGGAYGDNPDLVQYRDQFQSVGRGTDGNLWTVWYDPVTNLWHQEYQGVAVAS